MSEERRRILNMLAEGKVTADEAERLLDALGRPTEPEGGEMPGRSAGGRAKYLRVIVSPKREGQEQVNIRIPLGLLRAGMKFGGIMPNAVKGRVSEALAGKGIDIDVSRMNAEDLDRMIEALGETCIEVDDEKERVRICCE